MQDRGEARQEDSASQMGREANRSESGVGEMSQQEEEHQRDYQENSEEISNGEQSEELESVDNEAVDDLVCKLSDLINLLEAESLLELKSLQITDPVCV